MGTCLSWFQYASVPIPSYCPYSILLSLFHPTVPIPSYSTVHFYVNFVPFQHACDQIMERLKPYMERDPEAGWNEWVKRAYHDRINLSAQGFYSTPDLHFDWDTGRGRVYNYFSYGASCSEVEVDTLTGDFNVLRSDLLMDVGDSLNPAIDIGQVRGGGGLVHPQDMLISIVFPQVEGAFTQGLGLFTVEDCVYLEEGRGTQRGQPFTTGPGTYKIPSVSDIPVELNVSLMDRTPNPRAIFSSKVPRSACFVCQVQDVATVCVWRKIPPLTGCG